MEFEEPLDIDIDSGESPDPGEGAPPEPTPPAKPDPELVQLRKELETERARRAEADQTAQYWAERAKGARPAADEPEPSDEPADEDPDKFTEALAAEGVKALYKRGIPTKKDIMALIQSESAKVASEILAKREKVLTREGELIAQFPDLRDHNSEFFQTTRRILAEEFADSPEFQRTPAALKAAAKLAAAELKATQRASRTSDEELALRINSQSGRGSTRSSTIADDDSLGPQERHILNQMARYGVTEKDFKTHRAAITGRR